jgi:hypothetical protein
MSEADSVVQTRRQQLAKEYVIERR